MSTSYGGGIIRDGLQLYLDSQNPRSYAGEPTENLCTDQNYHTTAGTGASYTHEGVQTSGVWKGWNKAIAHRTRDSGSLVFLTQPFSCDPNVTYTHSIEFVSSHPDMVFHLTGASGLGDGILLEGNRYYKTFTRSTSGSQQWYLRWYGGTLDIPDVVVYYRNIQYEEKPYPTNFVAETRLAIDGWKDLIGNNHGDLTNMGFDSDGMLFTRANNDYIGTSIDFSNMSEFTVGVWIKADDISLDQMYLGSDSSFYIRFVNSKAYLSIAAAGQHILSHPTILSSNTWYNIVSQYTGSKMRITLNGDDVIESDINETLNVSNLDRIGRWRDTDPRSFGGKIDKLKIYNRALSSEEVLSNYLTHKAKYANS